MTTMTAFAKTPSLVRSLARAGWGDLAPREHQGVRAVLRALVDSLDDRSAQGTVTEAQVAQRCGLSLRWTRRCMHVLEDLGVIEQWRRGGIVAGKAEPSWLRLSKRVLVALIEAARPLREAADLKRRAETARRIAGLSFVRRNRRSGHAALSADLPTPTGDASASSPRRQAPPPGECAHGAPDTRLPNGQHRCPFCRREEAAA